MNRYEHIKRELEVLYREAENVPIKPFSDILMALGKKFDKEVTEKNEQFLAHTLASTVESLLTYQILTPVFGTDDEWVDVTNKNQKETVHQNNRIASIFMVDGKAEYLDAIIWVMGKNMWAGQAWHNGIEYTSNREIHFPFAPRTFHVEVKQGLDNIFHVKDEKTFLEAIKYFENSVLEQWPKKIGS